VAETNLERARRGYEAALHGDLDALRLGSSRLGELVDVRGASDTVVVIMRPPSADGKPAALSANLTTFRDGRVVEMVHYPRPQDALAAAGL